MSGERDFPKLSEFMQYLVKSNDGEEQLPSLKLLSGELSISIATLREQLEVARALGLVDVRPRTGIRRLPYDFKPAVLNSLAYATAVDQQHYFEAYTDLRMHIEAAYWRQAVELLRLEDHARLQGLVERAIEKLNGNPIQIPHEEHRELHLGIFSRLNNPFVTGLLEAYWQAYEAVGLNIYTDIAYVKLVWEYHRRMVDAICVGDITAGYHILIDHMNLLHKRSTAPMPRPVLPRHEFE